MQKKLLAAAVAAAAASMLAAPAAMAQSSVTISGVFKVGVDQWRVSNTARPRNTETRVTDNSSRIIFGITEDMGGGLAAIAQLDVRPQLDDAGETNVAAGNSWVGVRSSSLGSLTLGRHDLHYGKQPDDIASKAGALMAAAVSIMDYTYTNTAIANATRTANVVRWDSPNWGGFAVTAAWSASGGTSANESDMLSTARKGNAYNLNPSFTSGPFQVGASFWQAKGDASAAGAAANQTSSVLYGYYRFGAFKVGAAINQSEVEAVTAAGTTTVNDRRNWTVPVSWTSGPHNLYAHYTRAGEDDAAAAAGLDTKARMIALAYVYDLSKRTSVGLTYANLNNGASANYNLFTNAAALGSAGSPGVTGEDHRLIALTLRHAF